MLFYWLILGIKRFIWLFRLPRPEELLERDPNLRCPVCGYRKGWLRCVLQIKPGPKVSPSERDAMLPEGLILCQHRCDRCGCRWHEKPIAREVSPELVLPAVARNDLEAAEDRAAKLYQYPPIQ
jgi:hypothetical protein